MQTQATKALKAVSGLAPCFHTQGTGHKEGQAEESQDAAGLFQDTANDIGEASSSAAYHQRAAGLNSLNAIWPSYMEPCC